jgi:hypothetical protein
MSRSHSGKTAAAQAYGLVKNKYDGVAIFRIDSFAPDGEIEQT